MTLNELKLLHKHLHFIHSEEGDNFSERMKIAVELTTESKQVMEIINREIKLKEMDPRK